MIREGGEPETLEKALMMIRLIPRDVGDGECTSDFRKLQSHLGWFSKGF